MGCPSSNRIEHHHRTSKIAVDGGLFRCVLCIVSAMVVVVAAMTVAAVDEAEVRR